MQRALHQRRVDGRSSSKRMRSSARASDEWRWTTKWLQRSPFAPSTLLAARMTMRSCPRPRRAARRERRHSWKPTIREEMRIEEGPRSRPTRIASRWWLQRVWARVQQLRPSPFGEERRSRVDRVRGLVEGRGSRVGRVRRQREREEERTALDVRASSRILRGVLRDRCT